MRSTTLAITLRASTSKASKPASLCRATTIPAFSPSRHQQTRAFLGAAFQPNQTLTTTKTLAYPSRVIYDVISDVGAYQAFVPYCLGSIVTQTSAPTAADGKRYPEEAKLLIGFNNDISEEFTSRVYCVPGRIVEAVSGRTDSTLRGEEIAHHSPRPPADRDPSRRTNTMAHLLTRWTLRPYPYKPPLTGARDPATAHRNTEQSSEVPGQQKTEVSLAIEFAFANPLYAALSAAAAPKVAEKMIDAFEKRVKAVMEGQGSITAPQSRRIQGVIRNDK